ncbi:hypothetical protein F5X71_08395 [Nocardia brasiliensis]|uniref:Uncharacterized protein n=1 Tax=Nocardia brasiliensis TaxID=37326 RepID=A0A6G9XNB4_NOCBR|nr:hypothetical protein [Nocardia brasiliensis]QIS02340.1 hypothetical protein F5X71_08395 [Nocardia brasiliensis]
MPTGVFDRALRSGVIPAADAGIPSRPARWTAETVAETVGRVEEICAQVGRLDDVGAVRAAEALSATFGRDIDPATVEELGRSGVIPVVGQFKGHVLYSGSALERFDDSIVLEQAEQRGRLFSLEQAAAHLRVRVADLRHVVDGRWLVPVKHVHSRWQRRREAPKVALFRAADLDALAVDPAIDWDAVRATPAGRPSPLAPLSGTRIRRGR